MRYAANLSPRIPLERSILSIVDDCINAIISEGILAAMMRQGIPNDMWKFSFSMQRRLWFCMKKGERIAKMSSKAWSKFFKTKCSIDRFCTRPRNTEISPGELLPHLLEMISFCKYLLPPMAWPNSWALASDISSSSTSTSNESMPGSFANNRSTLSLVSSWSWTSSGTW